MGTAEKKALKRLGRGIFGLLISGIVWFISNNPASLALAPIVNMIGKYIREKLAVPNVPF
ncbi:hypothetical protein LCGC14_1244030 [marine sediment metagenome]|uniref:Uncharacterized protein n=1 Tax=marine sediment metagenome TaxID=412755 RepID=A0A0F9L8Z2_9ZZZZ